MPDHEPSDLPSDLPSDRSVERPESSAQALSRRDFSRRLSLLALGGAALGAGCPPAGSPADDDDSAGDDDTTGDDDAGDDDSAGDSCTLAPQQTEGPFWFDVDQIRADITEGRPGTPLQLTLTVVDGADCRPIRDAVVDIWHADHRGVYSGYTNQGHDGDIDATGETYLRGLQVTDADGRVTFDTIFPGWYRGRATHIHFKVHLDKQTLITSQLYFPDSVSDAIHVAAPYDVIGPRDTVNADDNFGGDSPIVLSSAEQTATGWSARLRIAVAD